MDDGERLGRRLPLWMLVLVGVVLVGVAVLLLLVDSILVFLAISPLTIVGLFMLAYAGGEWRWRSNKQSGRQQFLLRAPGRLRALLSGAGGG